ncbi:MAG: hypothetical protein FWH54_00175 [Methanobrevibacter sp.]|nr:hypothetical protein [Methanobrevibacter sp.]
MRYEKVDSIEELKFRIQNYKEEGYKIEWQSETNAKLKKDNFSAGVFILLLFFFIIGGLIYYAVASGKEDIVIISIDGEYNSQDVHEEQREYCRTCGKKIENKYDDKCPSCGCNVNEYVWEKDPIWKVFFVIMIISFFILIFLPY